MDFTFYKGAKTNISSGLVQKGLAMIWWFATSNNRLSCSILLPLTFVSTHIRTTCFLSNPTIQHRFPCCE